MTITVAYLNSVCNGPIVCMLVTVIGLVLPECMVLQYPSKVKQVEHYNYWAHHPCSCHTVTLYIHVRCSDVKECPPHFELMQFPV